MATFEEQYRKYSTSGQGQAINDMCDAKQQSQLQQLENAYQASRSGNGNHLRGGSDHCQLL